MTLLAWQGIRCSSYTPSIPIEIFFFNGHNYDIGVFGLYDAIFANSVLCRHPANSYGAVVNAFPFEDFESSLLELDSALKEGGLLAIVNTNYEFVDTEVSRRYDPIANCTENFVPKVDRVNRKLTHIHVDEKYESVCLWVKRSHA